MKNITYSSRTRGFTLIEALVAALVLALGMIAIGKLNGYMMGNSGHSKARSEAIALAEAKLEELRTGAVNNFATVTAANGNDSIPGKTSVSTFSRTWTFQASSGESKLVRVAVAWADFLGTQQTVELETELTPIQTEAYASLADDSLKNRKPRMISPTGAAKVGSGSYGPNGIPGEATDQNDGTLVHTKNDGTRELISKLTGDILLQVPDGRAFSKISGNVYIANNVSADDVYVMPSDAGVCLKTPGENGNIVQPWSSGPAGATYFGYVCYVGPGWYGNIGILRLDKANINERVCLGDPSVSPSTLSTSRHPILSISRMYRGYRSSGANTTSTGIGISFKEEDFKLKESYTATSFSNHHFMLATITGGVNNQACHDRMVGTGSTFTGNQGRFVCLSATCPDTLPTGAPPVTTVSGSIKVSGTLSILSVTLTGATCTLGPLSGTSHTFTCQLDWRGWTGDTWEGYMEITADRNFALTQNFEKKNPPAGVAIECNKDRSFNRVTFNALAPSIDLIEGINVIASGNGTCQATP